MTAATALRNAAAETAATVTELATRTLCQACGERTAKLYTYTDGATAELCKPCRKYEVRQAEIDHLSYLD